MEAMHQGVVPVTLAHGDVFINTGEAFAVADYGQMQQEIVRCISDPAYHQEKAALARERAAVLLDSYSAFTEVMAEFDRRMEQRERFWVSVIVPCYNVEKYVGKCLDSLLGQTIGAEHIQIIAVDDGSSDGTLDVLKRYEGRYPDSIVLIPLEENVGPGAARNIALEYVLADHVGYVDADDWVEPQMYELLLHEAEEGRLDFAACGYDRTSLRGEMLGYSGEKGTRGEMPGDQKLHAERIVVTDVAQRTAFLEEHRFDIMCTDKLFCTSFLRENHISFAEGVKYEDHYFGMLALLCCKRTSWSRAAMYHWFRNPSGTCMGGQAVLDRISVQTALYQECERRGFTQDHGELLQYDLYEKMVAETIFYLRRQKKDTEGLLPELMGKMAQLGIDIRTNSYYKKHIQ